MFGESKRYKENDSFRGLAARRVSLSTPDPRRPSERMALVQSLLLPLGRGPRRGRQASTNRSVEAAKRLTGQIRDARRAPSRCFVSAAAWTPLDPRVGRLPAPQMEYGVETWDPLRPLA